MTVAELIEKLKEYPSDALVMVEDDHSIFGEREVGEMYESTVTYGVLTPKPVTHKSVVLS